MLDPWAVSHSSWKKKIAGLLYEHRHLMNASCLHALCSAEMDAIRRYGLSNPICMIPCGVDVPPPDRPGVTRQEKVLLFLGRIHPKKGLVNLLAAWHKLQRDQASPAKDWKLWIAGWDQADHQTELQRWCHEQGLDTSVRFIGPKFGDDKHSLLRSVAAFVLPSFSEGLPVSVLEAWAYGLPVVMTSRCNLPQGFAAGAAVCIETDAPAMARRLLDVMAMSEEERSIMGMRGRELVQKQFSWASYAEQMHAVYAWIAGNGPKPECVSLANRKQISERQDTSR
jgi:poly(glycerol-phosphate) alpha-glucosyltransferase